MLTRQNDGKKSEVEMEAASNWTSNTAVMNEAQRADDSHYVQKPTINQ